MECECNPQFTQTKIQKGQFLLPFFFVCNKISLDEQILKRIDKQMLNQLVNENVTQSNKRIKKAASSGLFFTCF